jgi:S1-C subfamily serine protease
MKRVTLYSSNRSPVTSPTKSGDPNLTNGDDQTVEKSFIREVGRAPRKNWRNLWVRYERPLWVGAAGLLALLVVFTHALLMPTSRPITQEDIESAVLYTLDNKTLPSATAKAYEVIRPSVVRVRRLEADDKGGEDKEKGVGTGVVIVDKGIILTNVHVVLGAKRVQVVFADGLESDATVTGMQPENDLAVLQAHKIPDDLTAATMRSTADLAVGDQVVAVGFPFGIGPSATAGVVSGLRREFVSPEGKRVLTNLIQFDAAANPGSSGGPLVTARGEVVGIVTAILNPTNQRFFVGIGFAVPIENAATAAGLPPF